ncbi:unnamed protein product [Rotaria magnacalcarata]|uniref:Leucine-rich repeat-containing protein 14 n=1 Tax=Rotaria magnacalcarata TaxID=392030 RepID=A0A814VL17_9BILA|nr:unnamed protein product [Rotaria magnacalcarata]CAF1517514.1 unnamed protein product [Rotaria magnacalcarata]CAF2117935.1 unnamed protein product [Rotaria magnacalcarata]CAF2142742.1 unnamed protein product [Rotaria magnacalcarata]CAF3800247.1 unnamed protein product [Rotaria magnacalcarata]
MSDQHSNLVSNDFSYLFFRNGVTFQINYDDDEDNTNNICDDKAQVSKLSDLCCPLIVQNESLTEYACDIIPKELFYPLFRAALNCSQDDSCINILIARWPYRIFRLENFVQKKLTSLKMLLCDKTALQRTKQAIKYSVILIPRFIDSIRQQQTNKTKQSNLRILDVTNFPVVELILRYISTHCRLAEKESKRNQLIDIYHQQHQHLLPVLKCDDQNSNDDEIKLCTDIQLVNSNDTNDDLIKTSSYPDDIIIIRFDCIVQDYRTYVELLSALRTSTPNIQLQICTIDIRCIGLALVTSFLDHVDKRFVHTLRVPYNVLTRQNLKYFLPRLPSLTKLHTLDLSCNFIDFRLNHDDLEQFCLVLSQLKYLKNLSLSGSPVTNCLEKILNSIEYSLDVLNLDFCSLSENDLITLCQMTTRHQLLHLDLGTNRLNRFMRTLLLAIMKQKRLVVLELDYNRFSSNDYLELIACCQRVSSLKCLSVRGPNSLTTQLAAATFIGEHYPCLRSWKIASPIEYSLNRFVENDEQNYLIQTIMPFDIFVNEMNKRAKCLVSIAELSV